MAGSRLSFGSFSLDLGAGQLWRAGRFVALQPRALAVLRCLVFRAGQVVSTDEILETVWGDVFVTRSIVRVSIRHVRIALGDTLRDAAFIETVGRQGYRFVGLVRQDVDEAGEDSPLASQNAGELSRLLSILKDVCAGSRRTVFVSGEAGSGKTSLTEMFVSRLDPAAGAWSAQGRCVEASRTGEPYLPVLEALRMLGSGPFGEEVVAALRRHAPLWLSQLPGLVSPRVREALALESSGASPARMLRELSDALTAIAAIRPLVLVLEDLQWSDAATLDLVSFLARQRDRSRLLLLATYRPRDLADSAGSLLERLISQGAAEELTVSLPDEDPLADAYVEWPVRRLVRTPFVGRREELTRLTRDLDAVHAGSGRLACVIGEPGIGKTRLLEEFGAYARGVGARLLWGRCLDGESPRPFGAFADALASYGRDTDPETLREDLGPFGGALTRIAPELLTRLPDLEVPAALPPDEERPRLLDAFAQVLWRMARDAPVVLVLDDLHWADGATLALLRHLARFVPRHRVLLLAAYRDIEVDRAHPLTAVLADLRRELDVERLTLSGLDRDQVSQLFDRIAEREIPPSFVDSLASETAGNPFFLREVILHLLEEGVLEGGSERFASGFAIEEMGIPEGVREVIGRRLARLPEEANRLLATAAACGGPFRFDVVSRVAELEERSALDALDAALDAQLVHATSGEPDVYEFTHALIRHTLYADQSRSRQVRLHRRLAEVLASRAPDRSFEIAQHYARSAVLPGAERGVEFAIAAADRAASSAAPEEAAAALALALELLPPADPRRPRLLAQRGAMLARTPHVREATEIAQHAAELLAASETPADAARYLVQICDSAHLQGGFTSAVWEVARQGLGFVGDQRDVVWATLRGHDLDRIDAEDPMQPGILVDTPERVEIAAIFRRSYAEFSTEQLADPGVYGLPVGGVTSWQIYDARPDRPGPVAQALFGGDYRTALAKSRPLVDIALARGALGLASMQAGLRARLYAALGELDAADRELERAYTLAERAGEAPQAHLALEPARFDLAYCRGERLGEFAAVAESLLARDDPSVRQARAIRTSIAATLLAFAGRTDDAVRAVALVIPAVERAGGGVFHYTAIVCWACEVLWRAQRADFAAVLERNLVAKTLAGDFRYHGADARRAMAQLCALTARFDEAREWFVRAREVLDEQGARPLRALVDLDEAEMELRRGPDADRARASGLLDAARVQLQALGMHGWRQRADELQRALEGAG